MLADREIRRKRTAEDAPLFGDEPAVVDPGAFVMERRMLVRIRELAERWFRVVGVGYTAPGDGVRPTRTADPG